MQGRLRAAFRLVNRVAMPPEAAWQRLPLFEASEWAGVAGEDRVTGERLPALAARPELQTVYADTAAHIFEGKASGLALFFVVRADYIPQLRALELSCLDGQGLLRRYVAADTLVPITYHDFNSYFAWPIKFMEHIDPEMIYKDTHAGEIVLFLRGGKWLAAGANHPDLDFRQVFDESAWFEAQAHRG